MPFRTEAEPLREQIRRVEEQAQELLDERGELERQVAEQGALARRGLDSCRDALLRTVADLNRCRATLGQPSVLPDPMDAFGRKLPTCRCQPGDPLCSCF